ncbi:MAG: type VI secretion system baseplate subunit TssG [Holosporaceae bacterium]|jgi:type VI secretion system ImpH/TssG family protein|nr:type VI secretion system baseplate subunit TssG [Holosporaceae bacterium]
MGTAIRRKKLPLVEYLRENPRQFSFEMAARILEHGAATSFGKEVSLSNAPFRTSSINSFHLRGTEIEKIAQVNGASVIYVERLSLSGLNAPLPTPYAEMIFRSDQEKSYAMSAFINGFNSRLLGISYQISRRRYLGLQNHTERSCMLSRTIAAFCGEPFAIMDKRMSRLAYLFWIKEKSAVGLETIITASLGFTVLVREFQTFWAPLRETGRLGAVNLGKTAELGKRVSISSFGLEIALTHTDHRRIFQLLCDNDHLEKLKFLIRKYLGTFFRCQLKLKPQNVPPLKIEEAVLGKTAWLPAQKLEPASLILEYV